MALRTLSICLQHGYILLKIVGNGGSSQKLEKPDLDVVIAMAQWGHTSRLRGPSAPGEMVERCLLEPSNGVEWWCGGSEWLRLALNGGHKWYKVRRRMTRWEERE